MLIDVVVVAVVFVCLFFFHYYDHLCFCVFVFLLDAKLKVDIYTCKWVEFVDFLFLFLVQYTRDK